MKRMWKYEFNSNDTCGYMQLKDTSLWTIKQIWIWTWKGIDHFIIIKIWS